MINYKIFVASDLFQSNVLELEEVERHLKLQVVYNIKFDLNLIFIQKEILIEEVKSRRIS